MSEPNQQDGWTPAQRMALAKGEKEHLNATLAEMKAQVAEGELMQRGAVAAKMAVATAEAQSMIFNLAPKLKPHMSDAGKLEAEDHIRRMLNRLTAELEAQTAKVTGDSDAAA